MYLSSCRSVLVERMPVLDEATFIGRRDGSLSGTTSTPAGPSVNLPNGVAKPSVSPLVDLLDLNSDDAPAAPSSSGGGLLQDLLGVDLSPASQQSGWFKWCILHIIVNHNSVVYKDNLHFGMMVLESFPRLRVPSRIPTGA